jgi:hypothetical protein
MIVEMNPTMRRPLGRHRIVKPPGLSQASTLGSPYSQSERSATTQNQTILNRANFWNGCNAGGWLNGGGGRFSAPESRPLLRRSSGAYLGH